MHHLPRGNDDVPEGRLINDLGNLVAQWQELGIEPDAFVTCSVCGGIFGFAVLPDDDVRVCSCPPTDSLEHYA